MAKNIVSMLIMKSNIKSLLINTCGTISYLIVIFFFFTLILFLHNDIQDALKEAWVATLYFLSALATLAAAIVAAYLFNDWRDPANHEQKKANASELLTVLTSSYFEFQKIYEILINLEYIKDRKVIFEKYCSFEPSNLSESFQNKSTNAKILDRLDPREDDVFFEKYADYERHLSYFRSYFIEVQKAYIQYYNHLLKEMSPAEKHITLSNMPFAPYDEPKSNFHEKIMLQLMLERTIGFYIVNDAQEQNNKSKIYTSFNDMVKEIIKLHKDIEARCLDQYKIE